MDLHVVLSNKTCNFEAGCWMIEDGGTKKNNYWQTKWKTMNLAKLFLRGRQKFQANSAENQEVNPVRVSPFQRHQGLQTPQRPWTFITGIASKDKVPVILNGMWWQRWGEMDSWIKLGCFLPMLSIIHSCFFAQSMVAFLFAQNFSDWGGVSSQLGSIWIIIPRTLGPT